MAKVKVSTEVKAPVERVFALFTDIEHAADHVSGIKKIEVMSMGPFNLGYRWTETREVMGRLDDATMEITSFEPNRTYTVTHYKGGILGSGVRIDASSVAAAHCERGAANGFGRDIAVHHDGRVHGNKIDLGHIAVNAHDRLVDQPAHIAVQQVQGGLGPLDLLLELARRQKVDLARISILALAEQYLAFIDEARRVRLELAADYLVMAAWLAVGLALRIPKEERMLVDQFGERYQEYRRHTGGLLPR